MTIPQADGMELNEIALVVFLLAIVGAALSPFNEFLRSKFFSDGYRWRGFDQRDFVPLFKVMVLMVALSAGAIYEALILAHKTGPIVSFFGWTLLIGIFGNGLFSIFYGLRKAHRARQGRENQL